MKTGSQKHGKQFEDMLKALLYSGSADKDRGPTDRFDIEAEFDKKFGLATSVKASKNCSTIALADARRFWATQGPYRLLVACWRQKSEDVKEFYAIHEFIMHREILSCLYGEVSHKMVENFHDGLSLKHFPQGQHDQARAWAKLKKKELKNLGTLLILNPKIDSKTQRRLQCSVRLSVLTQLADDCTHVQHGVFNHVLYEQNIGDMILPQSIMSKPRKISHVSNAPED